jgi:hypothetical protein
MLKRTIAISLGLAVILAIVVSGCYKTTTVVVNPGSLITKELSFATDIIPIFQSSCALSGCHASGGHAPDLSKANAFSSLSSGGYFKAGDPDNSVVMLWLTGKKSPVMPLGSGPNQTINANIYAWINQGAKNN